MLKPKSFFKLFAETGPLVVLAVTIAILVGIVGPASAQFFNFGNFGGPPQHIANYLVTHTSLATAHGDVTVTTGSSGGSARAVASATETMELMTGAVGATCAVSVVAGPV